MDLKKYGFVPDMMPENAQGIPARITAVFKERYALVCEYGEIYGKLKTKEYFGGFEEFPTTGDFVLINYNLSGDSQIIKTLPRRTFFPAEILHRVAASRLLRQILIMYLSCSH